MSISISPSAFHTGISQTQKNYTPDEFNQLKKEPTKVTVKGDVYESKAIHFKKLTLQELRHEKIDVDTSKHTYTTYSDGSSENRNRLVAIRDPKNNGDIFVFDLSKKNIAMLEKKFEGSNNFFERDDGVLRLNGEAEAFVAGWMQEIRHNRNYDKADVDGNGLIEGDEIKNLTIGFERQNDYDYLGKKLVTINTGIGMRYQSLGRTPDAAHLFANDVERSSDSALFSQYARFENSIEKELNHTLQMDADLDGIVTLDETLKDKFGIKYHQNVITSMQKFHEHLLDNHPELNDETKLQNHNLGQYRIISQEEEMLMQETFKRQSAQIQQLFSQTKNSYFNQEDESVKRTYGIDVNV